jgi:hypothetical protein
VAFLLGGVDDGAAAYGGARRRRPVPIEATAVRENPEERRSIPKSAAALRTTRRSLDAKPRRT